MPIIKSSLLRLPKKATGIGVIAILLLSGCLLSSKLPAPTETTGTSQTVDTLYPQSATPDRKVDLFQPLLDASIAPDKYTAPEIFPPVNVKEKYSGQIVRYTLTRQRFGSWSPDLEFKWNLFLLQVNFLFPTKLPDTTGMVGKTKTLYDSIYPADAFTHYFDSAAAPAILNRITTSTKPGAIGIAIKLSAGQDTLEIQQIVAGSPAQKAGLVIGMKILAVNDSSVIGDSAIVRFQRFSVGDSGQPVTLTVLGAQGILNAGMIRAPVAFPTVLADSLAENVGYISISGFTPNTVGSKSTYTEFRDALIATKKFPMTILDFRDNGGGSVDISLNMCDEILTAETVIIREVQRRYQDATRASLTAEVTSLATSGGIGEFAIGGSKRKYLLLGNSHSASAAEIMIIALKEGAAAPLMGTRTFGKGVGQTVRDTPGHGLALVTFLKFTGASGLDYHKKGIEPDYNDSASGDSLLVHAALKAQTLLGKPVKKLSALGLSEADADVVKRAAIVEWNRHQTFQPANRDFDTLFP